MARIKALSLSDDPCRMTHFCLECQRPARRRRNRRKRLTCDSERALTVSPTT